MAKRFAAPRARYEAALSSPDRKDINEPIKHAYEDFTKLTREKLISIARKLEENDGPVNGLLGLVEQYAIGANGLVMLPDTSDDAYNAAARAAFEGWQQWGNIASRQSWGSTQRIISRRWATDGDIFIILTEEVTQDGQFTERRPRIQVIEGHRCQTPPELRGLEGITIFDGVEIDPNTARPIAYHFQTSEYVPGRGKSQYSRERNFRRVEERWVVHVADPSRIQEYRPPTLFHAVLNDFRDLKEWHELEMVSQKDAAETSKIVTRKGGEEPINPMASLTGMSVKATESEWTEDRVNTLRAVVGARTYVLDQGETMTAHQHQRPADSTQRFWDRIADRACAGVGIPRQILFLADLRGPMVHAAFDMANTYFRSTSAMFADHFKRVYWHVLEWERYYGSNPILRNPPSDWRKFKYLAPRAINVNIGRNSVAIINELRAGLRTEEEIAALDNRDWKDIQRQKAIEADNREQLLAEFPRISRVDLAQVTPNEGRDAGEVLDTDDEPPEDADT